MKPYPTTLSTGEETFALHCQAYRLEPTREHKFCDRGWRFDFAWPERKLAVEVEGGVHRIKDRFNRDIAKYNRAARDGWTVLRYSTRMVVDGSAIDEVLEVLGAAAHLRERHGCIRIDGQDS